MMDVQQQVAAALAEIGAVRFTPHQPVTFKSGIISPVYVDNRMIPFWPEHWKTVIGAFQAVIAQQGITFDVVAGIETAGIPHSAALGYAMRKPSIFVRKQPKEHGTRNRIEGGTVADWHVVLIEDLVTTGSSSLSGVAALREGNAVVTDCIAILSYGFPEAQRAFADADVTLHTLTNFDSLVNQARVNGTLGDRELSIISDWLADPYGWAERYEGS